MRVLGNILWFILGGLELGFLFIVEGLASFITLIGIPFGIQWFKIVPLAFCPFGKGIRYPKVTGFKVLGNILWLLIIGWWNAFVCFLTGLVFCITIIGIPFGKQWWKLARLLLLPFGAEVYNEAAEKKAEKRELRREERLVQAAAASAAAAAVAAQNNTMRSGAVTALPNAAEVNIGTWVCPNCGKNDNASGDIFCSNCGTKKPEPAAVPNPQPGKDFKETAADLGKKTAETAAAVGAKVSDVTTNTVIPFIKEKFVPAMKRLGSFIKAQCLRFIGFIKSHKEKILNLLPIAGAAVVGIVSVVLIAAFIGSASEKGKVMSEYNAEKQKHDTAVAEAEAEIEKYQSQANELNAENDTLAKTVESKTNENNGLDQTKSELQKEIADLKAEQNELSDGNAMFLGVEEDYNTSEYAEEQLADIIISQQDKLYSLKQAVSDHIGLLYTEFAGLGGTPAEYLYQVEPPMDITREFAKAVIGEIAGEFDSEIANIAADVASDVVDGTDLASSVGSRIQSAVQSKIKGAGNDLLNSATAGLYGKFNETVDIVNNFESLYNKLSDTTPSYCVRYIYQEIQKCMTDIGVFLDSETVTVDDIAVLMNNINRLSILENSYQDVTGELFPPCIFSINLCDTVQEVYNVIITDNERMAYYFALMEE